MKKFIFVLCLFMISPFHLNAQPQHFTFTANTGDSYSIVVDSATVDGNPLQNGDEIGVFTPAGLCVGAVVWTSTTPLGVTAWEDDSQTPATDGYAAGEAMSFKIWDSGTDTEYDATANYTQSNGNFGDGAYARLSLSAVSGTKESITVVSPNGGEIWTVGSQHEITWTSANFTGQVKLEYSIDGNASHITIVNSTDNDGSYMWTVPNTPSTNCVVIVSDATDGQPFDISDAVLTISLGTSGGGIIVTNTNDSGQGSLRDAIEQANSNTGPDTIRFEIPCSDPGFISNDGYWQIQPTTMLPALQDDSTFIDGSSQIAFAGDLNATGPEVEINGQNIALDVEGIAIMSSGNAVCGLAINQFLGIAVIIEGAGHNHNEIYDNFIGVDPTGTQNRGNQGSILIIDSKSNIIGSINDELANVIGYNNGPVIIEGTNATDNKIYTNFIGTDKSMTQDLGNNADGILFHSGAHNNEIRGSNTSLGAVVHNNLGAGVRFIGQNTNHNVILHGSISNNDGPGISLEEGANNNIPTPLITEADSEHVAGQAGSNNYIQIYADEGNQGALYLGSVYADASGNFEWYGEVEGPNVTATASDTVFNFAISSDTSPFSDPFPLQQTIDDHIWVITTTADTGQGSLRDAILKANSSMESDTILFQIPKSDPNYDPITGVWIIKPKSALPGIRYGSIYINGYSQMDFLGEDTNLLGPEIILDGSNAGSGDSGLSVLYTSAEIYGLTINNFYVGIYMQGVNGCNISGCYIGTDFTGMNAAGNGQGIMLRVKSKDVHIGPTEIYPGNVISGNANSGIILMDTSSHVNIIGNLIGLNRDASSSLGNTCGIFINNRSDSNNVFDNLIGGNASSGISIANSNDNEIATNFIGTDSTWQLNAGNGEYGIYILSSAQRNNITDNIIGYNGKNGIKVDGQQTIRNIISRNCISKNTEIGIDNANGGNTELAPPQNLSAINTGNLQISGGAGINQTIELFADNDDEGIFFIGSTMADASGSFNYTITEILEFQFITAIAIDNDGNTSEFSQQLATVAETEKRNPIPDDYYLSQNYPNPFNPTTEIQYEIPQKEHVTIKITNILGKEIVTIMDKEMPPGSYSVTWNGLDQQCSPVAGGVYFCKISAGEFHSVKKLILLK